MSIRSTVTALGATLVLAIALGTTAAPAYAAKSHVEQTTPPSVVDPKNVHFDPTYVSVDPKSTYVDPKRTKSKIEQASQRYTSNATSSKHELEQSFPESSTNVVNTGPTSSQGNASASTIGTTVPGVPAGSVVPSGNYGLTYQQVPGAGVGASSAGSTYPQAPAPLFQVPAANTGTGNTGAPYQQGAGSSSNVVAQGQGQPSQGGFDVRVVFVNSASNSSSTLYHFRVENVGSQPVAGINLSSVVREQSSSSNATRRIEEQYPQIASLAPGQSKDVVVTCTPRAGFQCMSGTLDALVANDLSAANNRAQS